MKDLNIGNAEKELNVELNKMDLNELGQNTVLYCLIGSSGVGKTWICNQLKEIAWTVNWDDYHGWDDKDDAVLDATNQSKPIILEISVNTSATISRYSTWATIIGFMAVETDETIIERRKIRSLRPRCSLIKLQKRFDKLLNLALENNFFIGTTQACLIKIRYSLQINQLAVS